MRPVDRVAQHAVGIGFRLNADLGQQLMAYRKFGVHFETGLTARQDLEYLLCLAGALLVWSWMYQVHFTPTSGSWLNLVERLFGEIPLHRINGTPDDANGDFRHSSLLWRLHPPVKSGCGR